MQTFFDFSAYMIKGGCDEVRKKFKIIVEKYPFSQHIVIEHILYTRPCAIPLKYKIYLVHLL